MRLTMEMADQLKAPESEYDTVPPGRLHALLGRRVGGYFGEQLVPMSAYPTQIPGCAIHEAYMVSTWINTEHGLEPYSEAAIVIETDFEEEPVIHNVAYRTRQHHYVIGHGAADGAAGYIALFETDWAR